MFASHFTSALLLAQEQNKGGKSNLLSGRDQKKMIGGKGLTAQIRRKRSQGVNNFPLFLCEDRGCDVSSCVHSIFFSYSFAEVRARDGGGGRNKRTLSTLKIASCSFSARGERRNNIHWQLPKPFLPLTRTKNQLETGRDERKNWGNEMLLPSWGPREKLRNYGGGISD